MKIKSTKKTSGRRPKKIAGRLNGKLKSSQQRKTDAKIDREARRSVREAFTVRRKMDEGLYFP